MRHAWISKAALGTCSVIAVLLLSTVSWALPKGTIYFECKCTCQYQDELGKEQSGPIDAVVFTESSAERCIFHKCTVTKPTGTYSGVTRNCTTTEKTAAKIPTGDLPTAQTLAPATTTTIPRLNIPGALPGGTLTR